MTAKKGSLVLVKVGNGMIPEVFNTLGGMRITYLELNTHLMDRSSLTSGKWRYILDQAGIQQAIIGIKGIFLDSESEERVRASALAGSACNYQFCFAKGDMLSGPFIMSYYGRRGDHDDVELYSIILESAGALNYTAV